MLGNAEDGLFLPRGKMLYQAARSAMVESQIRPNGVRDPRILRAFATVPRELYVPNAKMPLAYIDEALPVTTEPPIRYLLPPQTVARMLECAGTNPKDKALDIGGVTGYSAAILAQLCGKVFAIEATQQLADGMRDYLTNAGEERVTVASGALEFGLAATAPFDLIIINGSCAKEPKTIFDQLAEGGRLVCIIGNRLYGQAYLFSNSRGVVSGRPIFDAAADPVPGFEAEPQFVF